MKLLNKFAFLNYKKIKELISIRMKRGKIVLNNLLKISEGKILRHKKPGFSVLDVTLVNM